MDGFGTRVLETRRGLGWTRRGLAQRAGLHEQHLANIERGERHRLEGATIVKLARALGCTSDYLLGLDEHPPRPDVFVVLESYYEDWHILAVLSDRVAADRLARAAGPHTEVRCYPVDPPLGAWLPCAQDAPAGGPP